MSLPPSIIKDNEYLPHPTKNYTVDEAYSDVYKAVVEASMHKTCQKKYEELENRIPIGYSLSLLNCFRVNLDNFLKYVEEIKEAQKNAVEIEGEEALNNNLKIIKNKINETLKAKFLNIELFKNEKQVFKIYLNNTKYRELEFYFPNIINSFSDIIQIKEAPDLYNLNFEVIDLRIEKIKLEIEEQNNKIKEISSYFIISQEDNVNPNMIQNIVEARNIIKQLNAKMQESPKIIDSNQANISKGKLIRIRNLYHAL